MIAPTKDTKWGVISVTKAHTKDKHKGKKKGEKIVGIKQRCQLKGKITHGLKHKRAMRAHTYIGARVQ